MNETGKRAGWRGAPGWVKGLLVLSLSLNLAIASLVGGNAVRHWHGVSFVKGEAAERLDRRQIIILSMVPEESREKARAILLGRVGELSRARAALREANMAVIEAIRRDPPDPGELDQGIAERNAASERYWRIGSEQIVAIAQGLSAAERAEFASRLEKRMSRWIRQDRGEREK
jgi:hypothetical protein